MLFFFVLRLSDRLQQSPFLLIYSFVKVFGSYAEPSGICRSVSVIDSSSNTKVFLMFGIFCDLPVVLRTISLNAIVSLFRSDTIKIYILKGSRGRDPLQYNSIQYDARAFRSGVYRCSYGTILESQSTSYRKNMNIAL